MRHLPYILILFVLASCTKQEATLSCDEARALDSMALHIAVMPVMDCLPVYYAHRAGILDEVGLDARVHSYTATMDVDTAFTGGHAQIAYCDLIRALRLRQDTPLSAFMQTQGRFSLVTLKSKRVSKVRQMKERMIAITRLSAVDYWCDALIDSTKELAQEDVYRPQINDVHLRSEMLRTGLLEAAILPEPYATWMREVGNRELFDSSRDTMLLGTWILRADSTFTQERAQQAKLFVEAYNKAVDGLNQHLLPDTVKAILCQIYGLPPALADTLQLDSFCHATLPKQGDVKIAAAWLRGRNRLPRDAQPDSLIDKRILLP